MSRFFGKSRSQKRADNNLGIKQGTLSLAKNDRYRNQRLHEICKYVNGTQYDHLTDWELAECSDDVIPIRKRKPKLIYPFAQVLSERVSAKLLGRSLFPTMEIQEDPDTTELLDIIVRNSHMKSTMLNAIKTFITHNSVFVRSKVIGGKLSLEHYNPKYCYPVFDSAGELEEMEIRYVYEDHEDLDSDGKPIEKWYKMILGKMVDTLFDNPKYTTDNAPVFQEVKSASHGLGFVQGEWFRNGIDKHSPDGEGQTLVEKIYGFIDCVNYSLSQTDSAVAYGQDPQLVLSGMDEDEVEDLIKSSRKGWLLGREGQAQFLEVGGAGADMGQKHKESMHGDIGDISRVVFLDPEKIVGSAQSAKAMEVLYAPLLELIDEMRPHVERSLIKLAQKMLVTVLMLNKQGIESGFTIPMGYAPKSIDIEISWPQIFPMTTQDKQQIVSFFVQLTSGNLLSRETAIKNIIKQIPDIEVDDLELELQRVNTQKEFNSFAF